MCDMQNMPASDDASCEEDSDMNFAAFSPVSSAGTHYVTAGGQVAKLQQNVSNNGTGLTQVVGMVGSDGVQYVRAMDGSSLHATPQLISVPISLPGAKPGDPQPTVQIQVLGPNISLQPQQQPKYQMQIPIQGFQPGAVLTVAYTPEGSDNGGLQLVGQNSLADAGLQMLATIPQDMQLVQPSLTQQNNKNQVFITPHPHIIINAPENSKTLNNNNNNATIANIIIKEECDDAMHDDESQESSDTTEAVPWPISSNTDLVKYLGQLPSQQLQALPVSLQQFLRLNPTTLNTSEAEVDDPTSVPGKNEQPVADAVIDIDGNVHIQTNKKKKKYKKKPPKPPKPARPKPGQVVIATAADGTPIYCCPECQMAYPEKDQLEMHLAVHKAERRFICGICGAGLKRKEHLERHKLGHNPERPYVCGVCRKGFKRREHLNLHTVIHSGVKTEMCTQCGKGFYRKDHLRKHTRSHETKRARDEAASDEAKPIATTNSLLPEITIHVPTSANMQVPVQINIPQHVVSSLAAAQQAQQPQDDHGLEAFLANHS